MALLLEAKILNVFSTKQFTNKDTGEVTPPGWKVQMMYKSPAGKDGTEEKYELDDFNIRDLGPQYQKFLGQDVRVMVGAMVNDGRITFYIPRGQLPTPISSQKAA